MAYSKEEMRLYMANRRAKVRQELINLAGGKCIKCGSQNNLEFNHIEPESKCFNLSGKDLDRRKDIIAAEFKKCELLCSDCHKVATAIQLVSGKLVIDYYRPETAPYICGTYRKYNEKGCRCDDCKYAKKLARQNKVKWNEVVKAPS